MRKALTIGMAAAVLAVGAAAVVATAGVVPTNRTQPATSSTNASPTISQSAAEQIAANAVPGGHITEVNQQTVGGRPEWEVHVSTITGQHEVMIDAATGHILTVDHPNSGSSQPSPPPTATPTTPTDHDRPVHDVGDDHSGHQ